MKDFADSFSESPEATVNVTAEIDQLQAGYDFPAEHSRGPGSPKAALAMAYKLLDGAQDEGHKIGRAELVPGVQAGAVCIEGKLQEGSTTLDNTTTDTDGSVAA